MDGSEWLMWNSKLYTLRRGKHAKFIGNTLRYTHRICIYKRRSTIAWITAVIEDQSIVISKENYALISTIKTRYKGLCTLQSAGIQNVCTSTTKCSTRTTKDNSFIYSLLWKRKKVRYPRLARDNRFFFFPAHYACFASISGDFLRTVWVLEKASSAIFLYINLIFALSQQSCRNFLHPVVSWYCKY